MKVEILKDAIDSGGGILRLEPTWVPRTFMIPGRRLRLHPDDLYALGGHRGGINERWFSSATNADNGPGTPADEGLSYVRANGHRFLLKDAIDSAGDALLGAATMARATKASPACRGPRWPAPPRAAPPERHAAAPTARATTPAARRPRPATRATMI